MAGPTAPLREALLRSQMPRSRCVHLPKERAALGPPIQAVRERAVPPGGCSPGLHGNEQPKMPLYPPKTHTSQVSSFQGRPTTAALARLKEHLPQNWSASPHPAQGPLHLAAGLTRH